MAKIYIECANCDISQLKELINIDILQIEFNPFCFQKELLDYCTDNRICVIGYNSLSSSIFTRNIIRKKNITYPTTLLNNSVISNISKELACSNAQVLISWGLNHNVIQIPKATSHYFIDENIQAYAYLNYENFFSIIPIVTER